MATKIKEALIESNVGGINVYAHPSQVKDNESPDMLNCVFSSISTVGTRQGYTKLTTSEIATGHKGQGTFIYTTATSKERLYVSNGVLYKYNGSGGSTQITGGTFSTTANVNACQLGDRLYFADGVTALCYYDGSNIVTTGINSAPTKVKQLIKYNNRLYCNSDDNRDRVYYGGALGSDGTATNTGDFRSTSPAYAGYLGFGLGRIVTSFAKKDSSLYTFFEDCIYKIDPVSSTGVSSALDHSNVLISNTYGTRSPRSVENVGNDIGFLDSQYIFLGEVAQYVTIRTKTVSGPVDQLFKNLASTSISNVAAIYYDSEELLLIAVQVGTSCNDHIIGYAVPYKAWFYWDGIKANSFIDYVHTDNTKHLYFISDDSAASYVYELFSGTNDDGTAINAYYKTKEFDLDKFSVTKRFKYWNALFGGVYGTTTVNFYVDGALNDTISFASGNNEQTSDGMGTLPMGTFPMGLEGSFEVVSSSTSISNDWRWHKFATRPTGTTFQLEFANSTLNESFQVVKESVGYLEFPATKRPASRKV